MNTIITLSKIGSMENLMAIVPLQRPNKRNCKYLPYRSFIQWKLLMRVQRTYTIKTFQTFRNHLRGSFANKSVKYVRHLCQLAIVMNLSKKKKKYMFQQAIYLKCHLSVCKLE